MKSCADKIKNDIFLGRVSMLVESGHRKEKSAINYVKGYT